MLQSLSPANASERDSDGGFSLVEIMVALAIFLVASGAVLGLIMVSLSTIRSNADRVYAASLARAELDAIRLLPADQIPIGTQDPREVSTDAGDFTISVTTGWRGLPQEAISECQAGEGYILGGKAYVNARVSVAGGELSGPQVVDAVIYPNDAGSNAVGSEDAKTGTMTIFVSDVDGNPIKGATVSGELADPPSDFEEETDEDGCLFAPGLPTSADWKITLKSLPDNLSAEGEDQAQVAKVVDALLNTPANFVVARRNSLTVAVPVFPGFDSEVVEFGRTDEGSSSDIVEIQPGLQEELWPGSYAAWLRPCSGSVQGSFATRVVPQAADPEDSADPLELKIEVPKVQVFAAPGAVVNATLTSDECSASKNYDPLPEPKPTGFQGFVNTRKETQEAACPKTDDQIKPDPVTEITCVDKYFVPSKDLYLTSGTWTLTDGTNEYVVVVDNTRSGCSVILGDYSSTVGEDNLFDPGLAVDDVATFRKNIGVSPDTELEAPIVLPKGVPDPCPTSV